MPGSRAATILVRVLVPGAAVGARLSTRTPLHGEWFEVVPAVSLGHVDGNRKMGVAAQQMWCYTRRAYAHAFNMDGICMWLLAAFTLLNSTVRGTCCAAVLPCVVLQLVGAVSSWCCVPGAFGACCQLSQLSLRVEHQAQVVRFFTNLASAYVFATCVVVHKRCDLQPCGRCMLLCIACALGSLGLACTPSFYAAPCKHMHVSSGTLELCC